ncbi:TonB-dependent receptor [Caenimonas koreensis DSM 17982]|uniref:TonB-dependent receptor n=1 Tax=Caenimonas koreensis DSM 17982 TaxID=1121255 RepID=A0A844B6K4_9BURK|nr:TonB-dependent receptor [Caenimonas koreensis]MRD47289.1 TonB-dependent receptor [Caenimonas koreensis DSM 17982]
MNVSAPPARPSALVLSLVATCTVTLSPIASAQSYTLPLTTVTATRFAEVAQALPFGVSVVTADDISASGASTVNEALMRVLGIAGRQDFFGGGEYVLDLRGFGGTADNNQVVIVDGLRLSEADLGGTRLAGIPIESIERIEVIRGSGAVLYGEGATGGVIVITTKAGAGKTRPNKASVYGAAGSYGLRELRGNVAVQGGGFSLDASAQKQKADNYRDRFASDLDSISATGQWSNDWLRLGVRGAHDDLSVQLPGALSAAQYAANPRQSSKPADDASIRNQRVGVFVKAELGSWQVTGDAGTRDKRLRSVNSGFVYDYDVASTNYSLNARHEAKLGGAVNVLVLGASHERWTRDVLGAFGSTATQSSRALYAKDDITLAGGTRISAGLRTERIVKDNTSAASGINDRMNAWELGASQPVSSTLTAYARVGRSFRLANADEFSFTSLGASLLPQVSRDAELGARWAYTGGKVDARVYSSRLTHEIGYDPNAANFFPGANVNFDPTHRQGLEIDTSHALTGSLDLRVNAALREATFRSGPYAGKDVPLVPHRTLAVRADWKPAAGHRVTGGVNWVSSQRPDFDNKCSMPAYATADVRYAWTGRFVEAALGVTNLFDKKYYTQAFGCVAGTTESIYPEAGRAFKASIRASF